MATCIIISRREIPISDWNLQLRNGDFWKCKRDTIPRSTSVVWMAYRAINSITVQQNVIGFDSYLHNMKWMNVSRRNWLAHTLLLWIENISNENGTKLWITVGMHSGSRSDNTIQQKTRQKVLYPTSIMLFSKMSSLLSMKEAMCNASIHVNIVAVLGCFQILFNLWKNPITVSCLKYAACIEEWTPNRIDFSMRVVFFNFFRTWL